MGFPLQKCEQTNSFYAHCEIGVSASFRVENGPQRPVYDKHDRVRPLPGTSVENVGQLFSFAGELAQFPANMGLFRQGDTMMDVYRLEKGIVKRVANDPMGRSHILSVAFVGSVLGAESCLTELPAAFSAITLAPSELRILPKSVFDNALRDAPNLARDLMVQLSKELHELTEAMILFGTANARLRLLSLIRKLVECGGISQENGDVRINPCLKFCEMADMLAITPSYLSRLLSELERSHLLSKRNGWIIVHGDTQSRS